MFRETQMNFTIQTNHRVGTAVGEVIATDADLSPEIVYQLEGSSSFGLGSTPFSIRDNSSGVITLERELIEEGNFVFSVSAFDPYRREDGDSINVTVLVTKTNPFIPVIGGVVGGVAFLMILIIVMVLLQMVCYKVRHTRVTIRCLYTECSL